MRCDRVRVSALPSFIRGRSVWEGSLHCRGKWHWEMANAPVSQFTMNSLGKLIPNGSVLLEANMVAETFAFAQP